MNIRVKGKDAFQNFVNLTCEPVNSHSFKMLEKYGEGFVHNYSLNVGLNLIVFDIKLKDPLIFHWELSPSNEVGYFLIHNVHNSDEKQISQNEAIVENGEVIFSDHNERRRLWMPEVNYKLFAINFSSNWFTAINTIIPFPKHIWNNLHHMSKLYLHHLPTANTSLVCTQILKQVEKYEEGKNTYLEIKCVELIYFVFTETLQNINERTTKSSIHPEDLAKLNDFMGRIYMKLDAVPEIDQAAEELGMSSSKFQRIFKSLVGNTYYNYVYTTKMNVAMEQLINGASVSEVAYNLGYGTIGNFTQAFKRLFDIVPSEVSKQGNNL